MSPRRLGIRPAIGIFVGVLAAYALTAWERLDEPSPQFHFVDLAHSLMQGRLDTDTPEASPHRSRPDDPPGYRGAIQRTLDAGGWNDWAALRVLKLKDGTVVWGHFPWADAGGEKRHMFHTLDGRARKIVVSEDLQRSCAADWEGKPAGGGHAPCDGTVHYVSFPPFPALALMPAAAVWGYHTNDVLITLVVAAFNAVLLFWLLQLLTRRGHSRRTTHDNVWWTILFALGSVAWFSSVRGEVWFTALVFGVTLNLLFALAALDTRHPWLAGWMLGFGMATRAPIAFCVVFFGWQLFWPNNRWRPERWGEILRKGAAFAVPVLVCGGLLMAYNAARFGDPLEFGHRFLSGGAGERIREHGLFDTWYLNGNLSAMLVNLPRIVPEPPFLQITKHGLSLLATTPALLLLLRPRRYPPLRRACWLTVAAAAVPALLYQNTGWEQFGYRFALDWFPYLVVLLAIGGRPLTRRVKVVILVGVAVNLFGAITFLRFPGFYY